METDEKVAKFIQAIRLGRSSMSLQIDDSVSVTRLASANMDAWSAEAEASRAEGGRAPQVASLREAKDAEEAETRAAAQRQLERTRGSAVPSCDDDTELRLRSAEGDLEEVAVVEGDEVAGGDGKVAKRRIALLRSCHIAFRKYDQDHSGKLDHTELREAIASAGITLDSNAAMEMLAEYDVDQSGLMEFDEFQRLCCALSGEFENKRAAFNQYDRDQSGKLDHKELREALALAGITLDPEAARRTLAKYDVDQSGLMEFDEFSRLCSALSSEFDSEWTIDGWLKSLSLPAGVSAALTPPPRVDPFTFIRGLTYAEVEEKLGRHELGGLARTVWDGVLVLSKQRVASGAALNEKFKQEAHFCMQFASIEVFYGGLEKLIGPPQMMEGTIRKTMEFEHCQQLDSYEKFDTSNGATSFSAVEWEFVLLPVLNQLYSERGEFEEESKRHLRRKPISFKELEQRVEERNDMLAACKHTPMVIDEAIAGRLYSGPMFEKYNAVLRSFTMNEFLVAKCQWLCMGNKYVTTIHAINSCVIKLSKLTKAATVYRGFAG